MQLHSLKNGKVLKPAPGRKGFSSRRERGMRPFKNGPARPPRASPERHPKKASGMRTAKGEREGLWGGRLVGGGDFPLQCLSVSRVGGVEVLEGRLEKGVKEKGPSSQLCRGGMAHLRRGGRLPFRRGRTGEVRTRSERGSGREDGGQGFRGGKKRKVGRFLR